MIVNATKPRLEVVNDEGYINQYYSSSNQTSVTISITFNREVNSGNATIKYYDDTNNLLETKRSYFTAYNEKTAKCSYEYINGKVASYEIESYEFSAVSSGSWVYCLLYFAIPFFILSLLICYKEYDYNGRTLSVYAGWYHHTLRVDGVKFDEHNTFISYSPLKLNTTLDDGAKIDVTISLTNRITLKINDRLVTSKQNNLFERKKETDK